MEKLIETIDLKAKALSFSGVISVFEQNKTLYNKGFGYRDVKNKVSNEADTKFGIASGTKFFTALGIGKLIDQRKLSFETKMKEIDPRFAGFIDGEATILSLLTHTSGVYDYFDEETIEDFENFSVDIPWYRLTTPSDYLPLFQGRQMKFEANKRFSYSNGGYVLLGIILEKLTDRTYRDFMEEEILVPAGMHNSGFFAFNDLPENTANGYLGDGKTTNIYKIPIRGGGDGGMYTTTGDLQSFWKSLFSFKLLSEELTKGYLKTYHQFSERYGYGCGVYKDLQNQLYYIVGGDAGVGFDSRYIPEKDLVINILSNKTNGEEEMRKLIRTEVDRILSQ